MPPGSAGERPVSTVTWDFALLDLEDLTSLVAIARVADWSWRTTTA